MKNRDLSKDYYRRARARLAAIETLLREESFADVVRESQEVLELCSKALLRDYGIEPARVHDVSDQLNELLAGLDREQAKSLSEVIKYSRHLRRDRELAFYGGEDITPGEFYKRADADEALMMARRAVEVTVELSAARAL